MRLTSVGEALQIECMYEILLNTKGIPEFINRLIDSTKYSISILNCSNSKLSFFVQSKSLQ